MESKEIAKLILDTNAIVDYRQASDCPFQGLMIPCSWDIKDDVRKTLVEALILLKHSNPVLNTNGNMQ